MKNSRGANNSEIGGDVPVVSRMTLTLKAMSCFSKLFQRWPCFC